MDPPNIENTFENPLTRHVWLCWDHYVIVTINSQIICKHLKSVTFCTSPARRRVSPPLRSLPSTQRRTILKGITGTDRRVSLHWFYEALSGTMKLLATYVTRILNQTRLPSHHDMKLWLLCVESNSPPFPPWYEAMAPVCWIKLASLPTMIWSYGSCVLNQTRLPSHHDMKLWLLCVESNSPPFPPWYEAMAPVCWIKLASLPTMIWSYGSCVLNQTRLPSHHDMKLWLLCVESNSPPFPPWYEAMAPVWLRFIWEVIICSLSCKLWLPKNDFLKKL